MQQLAIGDWRLARAPVTLAPLLVLLVSLVAGCGESGTTPGPSPLPGAIQYTAVGASDALGIGASVVCFPFSECPDGTGYVPVIARELASGGASVKLTNLGIPAAVLGPGIQQIGISFGRTIPGNFLEQEMPFVPRDSTHVTIFAGGNDTNTLVAAVGGGAGGDDPLAWVDGRIREFADDYSALIRGIRERAPQARIVVANLPNFAGVPFTRGYGQERIRLSQYISVGFTIQAINPLANQGVPVVDMLCDPLSYEDATYSSDGFHPSDAGYAHMAAEMLRALADPAGYRPPADSCGFMTLVAPL